MDERGSIQPLGVGSRTPLPHDLVSDRRLITITIALVVGGAAIVGALMFFSGRGGEQDSYGKLRVGDAASMRQTIEEGGAIFIPDPIGGNRSSWIDLEGDEFIALRAALPGEDACDVRWRQPSADETGWYQDCHGGHHQAAELDRFDIIIESDPKKGERVSVDLATWSDAPISR